MSYLRRVVASLLFAGLVVPCGFARAAAPASAARFQRVTLYSNGKVLAVMTIPTKHLASVQAEKIFMAGAKDNYTVHVSGHVIITLSSGSKDKAVIVTADEALVETVEPAVAASAAL